MGPHCGPSVKEAFVSTPPPAGAGLPVTSLRSTTPQEWMGHHCPAVTPTTYSQLLLILKAQVAIQTVHTFNTIPTISRDFYMRLVKETLINTEIFI
jgi:hypothetical protein